MNLATKVGLGVAALAVAGVVAVRLGGSRAAKSGLDDALNNLPPGWAATHGAVTYDALSGQAEVDNLVLTRDGKPFLAAGSVLATGIQGATATTPPTRIDKIVVKDLTGETYRHVAHLEIDGLEVANLSKVLDPAAYPNGKPASTAQFRLLTSVDASDVQVHVDLPPPPPGAKGRKISSVDVHADHIHNDGVSARQFASPPENGSLQDYAFIADAARAISYEGGSAKGLTETLPGIGVITVGTLSVTDFANGKIGSEEVRDIAYTGESKPDTLTLDSVALKNIDLNKLLDSLPQLQQPGGAGKVNTSFRIGQFDADVLKADFEHAPLVTLDSLEAKTNYHDDGTQDGGLTMRALKFVTTGRETKPQVKLALDRFGMQDFTIDLDESATYAPADGHLKLSRADFNFHDLGMLHLALDATGLQNASGVATNQAAALAAITLIGATVQWNDASLTNRVFKVVAAQSGKSVEDLHTALALPVASLGMFLPDQPDAPAQVSAFLADPKQLTITLAPPSPVSLLDVAKASPQQKASLLGVTIKGD